MTFQGPFEGELERALELATDVALRQSINGPFYAVSLNSDEILLITRAVMFLTERIKELGGGVK